MTLKEKLLNLGIVIDNEYLDKYVELVETNRNTKREKFKTQRHHIVPKHYYKLNELKIDNSKSNFVNLFYKDHFIAHLLLAMCSSTEDYFFNNFIALSYMSKKFNHKNLDILQEEYEQCRKRCAEHNPMYNEVYKQIHDESMRSEDVRSRIASTMKKHIANGEFFTKEHREKISASIKDGVYIYNDERITRVRKSNLQEYLNNGWKVYEKRSYDQLCNHEMMTVKTNNFSMFNSRSKGCYCVLDSGERFEFRSMRDATIWWFENYHPFGSHYSECTLQRKIKQSIKTGHIKYGNHSHKKHVEITNIHWYALEEKGGGLNEKVNTN